MKKISGTGLLALLLSIGTAQAATVFTDDFNGENGSTPVLGTTSLSRWNVVDGNVDLIGNGLNGASYDFYPGHGYYLDLDGTGRSGRGNTSNASIETTQVFGAGSYMVSFLLGNNPGGGSSVNPLTVSLGSYSTILNTTGYPPFSPVTLSVLTTGGRLSFAQGGSADQQGSIIDNVEVSTATPEPSSVATVISGLAGLLYAASRRRRG